MTAPHLEAAVARPARFPAFALRPVHHPLRRVLAGAAFIAAAAHVPVIAPHLAEAPYMGVLFIALTAACMAIGLAALVRDAVAVYGLAALTCGLAVVGYAATRLVSFPMLADDVGNWLEPLGVVSVLSELTVVAVAVAACRGARSGRSGHRDRLGLGLGNS